MTARPARCSGASGFCLAAGRAAVGRWPARRVRVGGQPPAWGWMLPHPPAAAAAAHPQLMTMCWPSPAAAAAAASRSPRSPATWVSAGPSCTGSWTWSTPTPPAAGVPVNERTLTALTLVAGCVAAWRLPLVVAAGIFPLQATLSLRGLHRTDQVVHLGLRSPQLGEQPQQVFTNSTGGRLIRPPASHRRRGERLPGQDRSPKGTWEFMRAVQLGRHVRGGPARSILPDGPHVLTTTRAEVVDVRARATASPALGWTVGAVVVDATCRPGTRTKMSIISRNRTPRSSPGFLQRALERQPWPDFRGKVQVVGLLFPWSGWPDLNRRPLRPERSALPSCATPRDR